mgnify:CR=1 FL=1
MNVIVIAIITTVIVVIIIIISSSITTVIAYLQRTPLKRAVSDLRNSFRTGSAE